MFFNHISSHRPKSLNLRTIPGLVCWLDAVRDDTFTLSSGKITQWSDRSGNSSHATQAIAVFGPTYSGYQNNLPTVSFSSSYLDITTTAITSLSQPITVCIASTEDSDFAGFHPILDGITNSNERLILFRDINGYQTASAGTSLFTAVSKAFGFALRVAKYDGASSYLRINGTQEAAGNAGTHTPANGLRIAADHDLTPAYSDIEVGEVAIFSGALSASNLARVEDYFMNKWGI